MDEEHLNDVLHDRLLKCIDEQNELTESNIVGTFYRYGRATKAMGTQITPLSRMRHQTTVSSYSQRPSDIRKVDRDENESEVIVSVPNSKRRKTMDLPMPTHPFATPTIGQTPESSNEGTVSPERLEDNRMIKGEQLVQSDALDQQFLGNYEL